MLPESEIMENVHRFFATEVALITSNSSKYGPNVMAVEWTMQIAYDPILIAIFIHDSPTYWNIQETNVFAVNMASEEQSELVNIAGGYSGIEIQKLTIPNTFDAYTSKYIDVPMIKNCTVNAECKVKAIQTFADHIMVVGEVVRATFDEKELPLIYTRGNYRRLSRQKISGGRKRIVVSHSHFVEFKTMSNGQFILKAAVAVIRDENNKLLLIIHQSFGNFLMLPMVSVKRGSNYVDTLHKYLETIGIITEIESILGIERVILMSNYPDGQTEDKKESKSSRELRANFISFSCKMKSMNEENGYLRKWLDKAPMNTLLRTLVNCRGR
jgi:flavin reductase (DIM6/NTAB) family NADH-FMN oxidoreductase RutF